MRMISPDLQLRAGDLPSQDGRPAPRDAPGRNPNRRGEIAPPLRAPNCGPSEISNEGAYGGPRQIDVRFLIAGRHFQFS